MADDMLCVTTILSVQPPPLAGRVPPWLQVIPSPVGRCRVRARSSEVSTAGSICAHLPIHRARNPKYRSHTLWRHN